MNYMDDLNKEQKLAVETVYGPLLVLSGAGTGKTRVLTSRIAHILYSGFAYPWQILALTFTNKAANEMRYRIAGYSEISHLCRDLWMGTFHSMCLRILRANSDLIGLRRDFLIYDESQQLKVLKRVMENLGLSTKEYSPSDWIDRISNIKDKGIYDIEKATFNLNDNGIKIFTEYNAELARIGAIDFGDIILYVIKLFSTNEEILRKYQKQFKFILVDEFQDTNAAQMTFLKLLTKDSEEPNICCVGDDDQSIYSWRGAEIKNILDFEKTYKNAKIIRLETNYRNTGNILGAANSLIKNNKERLGKELRVAPGTGMGDKVYIETRADEWDEARLIANVIQKAGSYKNFVVLIRSASVSRPIERTFNSYGIPYKIVGATKFYEREEIKDAISYIRLLVYPFDDISFERIISKPSRQIGPAAINKLRATGKSLMEAIKTAKLSAKQQANVQSFLDAFDFDWKNMEPKEAVRHLLESSGYLDMWRNPIKEEDKERLGNIEDLLKDISEYDNLQTFLENATLKMVDDNDVESTGNNIVYIMTIHAAKGSEFDTVFLPAWEEGIFPNSKSTKEGDIEEERRLAYVALTRAKSCVIITNANERSLFNETKYNPPSCFIGEIDKRFVFCLENKKSVVGKMVKHKTLGNGVVIAENNNVLTIAFKTKGIKNIVREFVEFV